MTYNNNSIIYCKLVHCKIGFFRSSRINATYCFSFHSDLFVVFLLLITFMFVY